MRRSRTVSLLLHVLLLTTATVGVSARADDAVFVERFRNSSPGDRWKVETTLDKPSLRRHRDGERPGFHFRSVAVDKFIKGHAYAWTGWDVGTRSFDLSWDVYMERGLKQRWFYPGVAVALTSSPPGEMTEDDVAISIGVHMGGMAASVRKGGLYNLYTEGRNAYARFRDHVPSDLTTGTSGGTASVKWPMKDFGDNLLRFRIRRTAEDTVQFSIRWPSLPGDRGTPFWTGEWTLPDELAKVPLRYISIKRMPVKKVHVSYSSFVIEGVVSNIQGRLFETSSPPPVVDRFSQERAVLEPGAKITVEGSGFRDGSTVEVGGTPVPSTTFVSSKKVRVTLPEAPLQERHALTVTNPDGLTGELDERIPYGRLLGDVRPREVLPQPEQPVTVTGAGFEEDTVFRVGTKKAELVERMDPLHARIRVPEGRPGLVKLTATTGDRSFAGKTHLGYAPHPYLFFNQDDRSDLRQRFRSDFYEDYRQLLLSTAKKRLDREVPDGHGPNVGAITVLSWAYVLTGEDRYRKKAMQWVRRGFTSVRYSQFNLMGVGAMAVAYDLLFRDLTPEQKTRFQRYLDRVLTGYLKEARGGTWFLGIGDTNFSNTVPVANSGGMLVGLALTHSTPEAESAIDHAARNARLYSDQCITSDGGCQEGGQYWDYGMSFYLIMAHALKNTTGDGRGLLDHPHLRENVRFVEATLGGHGGLFAFNDTREPWLTGFSICADFGSRFDQPLMRWVADRIAAGGRKTRRRGYYLPYAFLWRDQKPVPEFPGVPTLSYLKSMHWGAMRSDSSFMPDLVVGVKGGQKPHTHHTQKDPGSYVVHANGEAYLIDPGYYEGEPTDHTLPLIDGTGPGVDASRITDAREQGSWRRMTLRSADTSRIPDIVPAKDRSGEVTAQYQTATKPVVSQGEERSAVTIPGNHGKLVLRTFGYPLKYSVEDRKFSNENWHWSMLDEDGPKSWHTVTGTYTVNPDRPLVTVLTPVTPDGAAPEPTCHYGEKTVRVTFPDGPVYEFRKGKDGWTFEMPE